MLPPLTALRQTLAPSGRRTTSQVPDQLAPGVSRTTTSNAYSLACKNSQAPATLQQHPRILHLTRSSPRSTLTSSNLGFLEVETHGRNSPAAETTAEPMKNILSPSAVATVRCSLDPPRPPMDLHKPPRHPLRPLSPQDLGISVLVAKST
jgi:hypothetical protein